MKIIILSNLAGLVALVTAETCHAQYTYSTVDFPGASATLFSAIDGTNMVGSYADASGQNHSFFYNGNAWTTLDDPLAATSGEPWYGTFATGISGSNIVGFYYDSSGSSHGFLYDGNDWTDLDAGATPWPVQTYAQAYGISGNNIVGVYDDNIATHGFLYTAGSWRTLDDPLAKYNTIPVGISGSNIVGSYEDSSPSIHKFFYNGSTWMILGGALASASITGVAGNNILGYLTGADKQVHGFIYNGVTLTTLDHPLAGTNRVFGNMIGTRVAGMSGNTVVGSYDDTNGVTHGFIANLQPFQLSIMQTGNVATVAWPYSVVGWSLFQNADLSTTNWTLSVGVSNDGTNNFIRISAKPGSLFFRLSQQ